MLRARSDPSPQPAGERSLIKCAGGQAVAIISRASTGANATRYLVQEQQGSTATIVNNAANAAVAVEESFDACNCVVDLTPRLSPKR
jgi:hypothetical protein